MMLGSTSQVRRDSDLAKEVTRLRESELPHRGRSSNRKQGEASCRRNCAPFGLRRGAIAAPSGRNRGSEAANQHERHRVRAKETVISRMQERMESEAARQQAAKDRDRDLFARIQNRQLKPGSASDRKTLDVIRMYESQRENMEKDLESLRREVRRLNLEVKDRENALHRKDYWRMVRATCGSSDGQARSREERN